jgi:hypothetical protein
MNFEKIASTLTNEEIDAVIGIFHEEQQRRKRVQRQKLIDNFRSAFSELLEAGITPKYYEHDEWNTPSPIFIEKWDSFEF